MRNTKRAGDLAEIAFLYRAMGLGMVVSKPFGDNARYDFVVDGGRGCLRVQVKSSSRLHSEGRYNVNVGRHVAKGAVAYLASEIDFVAVLIVPEARWYIFPVAELAGRVGLKIPVAGKGPFEGFVEAWGLLQKVKARGAAAGM